MARFDLDNAIFGDRQNIRNTLAEERRILLAYRDLDVEKIREHISQDNFNYRKQLDLLYYRKRIKSNELINAKLLAAELIDRLIYAAPGQLPIEVTCKILTARVNDANLKKEAAIVFNESYKKIINVCKKDAIYFDVILESLRLDRSKQGKCMLNAIILGQLATEYLYDRREEFKVLEHIVKENMVERQKILSEMEKNINVSTKQIKFLIRKDSDITLPVKNPNSNLDVQEQISYVCKMMDVLKHSFCANSYFKLNDCLQEQRRQRDLLNKLKEKFVHGRDALLNKINHINLVYDNMDNTMIATTFEYKAAKQSLKDQILAKSKQIAEFRRLQNKHANILVRMKASLQHLEQRCKYVRDPFDVSKINTKPVTSAKEIEKEILDIKPDCLELLAVLAPKLMLLSRNASAFMNSFDWDLAQMNLAALSSSRAKAIEIQEEIIDESLVEDDVTMEDYSAN